jgi:uncharacterized membrane protein YdjX (TVP38/TMEM64 family)
MFSSAEDRPKLLLFSIGVLSVVAASYYLLQHGFLTQLLLWFSSLGSFGFLLFIMLYIVFSFPIPMGTTPLGAYKFKLVNLISRTSRWLYVRS